MTKENKLNLEKQGYCILKNAVEESRIDKINEVLPSIFKEHQRIRSNNNNAIKSNGVALNALVSDHVFIDLLESFLKSGLIEELEDSFFKGKCIVNSLTALNNIPNETKVFHKNIHRDIRFFSGAIPIMLNMLIMLDDFTDENGATLLLPNSHKISKAPSENFFNKNHVKACGVAGDIVIWNSNLFHASGVNSTNKSRRALPITLSLPSYKQLLDYPRALGYEKTDLFCEEMQTLLGYNARVPASLNEWYFSDKKRLYKN